MLQSDLMFEELGDDSFLLRTSDEIIVFPHMEERMTERAKKIWGIVNETSFIYGNSKNNCF